MNGPIDEAPVARARELRTVIREHAAEAEHERSSSRPVLDALHRTGVTRMLLPKSLGVLETDPPTMLRVMEEIARHDGVAAWVLMVSNASAFTGSRFPSATVETLFSDLDEARQASGFSPPAEHGGTEPRERRHQRHAARGGEGGRDVAELMQLLAEAEVVMPAAAPLAALTAALFSQRIEELG